MEIERREVNRGEVGRERDRMWTWVSVGALLSVLMRLRAFWTPVNADEGAYLAIARAWSHGRVLYRDVWIDRPQGVLALFRVWDWLSGGSTASIRIMAMLFGVILIVATAIVVRATVSSAAAGWAAVVCGVVSSAPVIEGYTANGELLSGAVSAAGLAMAVSSWSKGRRLRWFFGSGVLFGLALSVKQSGFDGLGAICAWLIVGSIVVRSRRREALRAVGATIAGMVCVVGVLMIEGAIAGWSRWWNAVVGYRLGQQSGFSAEWANLITTLRPALAVLGPTAVAALVGVVLVFTPSHPSTTSSLGRRALVLPLWALTSVSAFLIGGGFWRHYWVLLAAPLSALAGVALSRAGRAKPIAFGALVVPCLTITVWAFAGDGDTLTVRTADYRRAPVNVRVADWFLSHRREGDTLYVLCNSPAVYAMAHQDPGYPYLYLLEVRNAPRGRELLVSYLSDPARAPRYIASYEKPSKCDPSGRVKRILSEDYHPAGKISFVTMYRRNDDSAPRRLPHR